MKPRLRKVWWIKGCEHIWSCISVRPVDPFSDRLLIGHGSTPRQAYDDWKAQL